MSLHIAQDQENLVHNLHAGPNGKSLNAGLKGFNAKTPGHKAPKTPFKVPLNDENAVFKAGKSVLKTNGKGDGGLLMTNKKGAKLDESAFVTPAGPRARAPLGMKTTNAKAKAFQTPAPLSASGKTQKLSPRLRKPKVKVHQPETEAESEDDVPEVEYMPPKEVPLPDNLDEDMPPINWDFPMLKGTNAMRGISELSGPIEADGRSRGEREDEESFQRNKKKANQEFDKLFAETVAKEDAEARRYLGIDPPAKSNPAKQVPKRRVPAPSTMKAKSPAAALSPVSKPSFAAPSTATRSRVPFSAIPNRKPGAPTMNPSASRNAAAVAASKSTIGYAQGRAASIAARKPLSNVTRPHTSTTFRRPTTSSSSHNRNASTVSVGAKSRGDFSRSSSTSTQATLVASQQENERTAEDVEREMELLMLQDDEDEDVDAWMDNFRSQMEGDSIGEEYEDFQFQLPDNL